MSIYKTCPDCGMNLDPGERCDCQQEPKYILHERDVATLILVEIAISDIVEDNGILDPDILDELKGLAPKLEDIVYRLSKRELRTA